METFNYLESEGKPEKMYSVAVEPKAARIMSVFNHRFEPEPNATVLLPGCGDPLYIPAGLAAPVARIYFAHGFASSALHEAAHWCIAGVSRRQQVDYGYWYVPDGRDATQQEEFYRVEAKPQGLEWMFSLAVDIPFFVSCDNLDGPVGTVERMRRCVRNELCSYWRNGLPARAGDLLNDLLKEFGVGDLFYNQLEEILAGRRLPG